MFNEKGSKNEQKVRAGAFITNIPKNMITSSEFPNGKINNFMI